MPSIDQLSIEIEASAKKAIPELDELIGKLTKLGDALSLKNFDSFNNGIGTLQHTINRIDTAKLDKLANTMERISGKGFSSSASSLSSGLGRVGRNIASMGTKAMAGVFTTPYKAMAAGMKGIASASVGAAKGLRNFFSASGVAGTSAQSLVRYLTSIYAKIWMLRRVLSSAMSGIRGSMDLVETYHYFETVYDKIGKESKEAWSEYGYESAEAYAQSFRDRALQLNEKMSGMTYDQEGNPTFTGKKSLGLDSDLVHAVDSQTGECNRCIRGIKILFVRIICPGDHGLIGIGFAYAVPSHFRVSHSRAVRSLGIDITQAALANTAASLGIETSVSKMNQAQKAELRMIAILQQSRVAWGDLAKTLNTPANQFRLLEQNLKSLARTIGSLFLPIVAKVLPYINGLVIALQRLFQWLGKMLGISGAGTIASQGGMGDLGDDFEDMADSAEEAEDKVKELKNTILAFDELNVLNDPDKDKKKDEEDGMTAAEQALLNQSLLDLLDEYEKAWNAAFERMQSKAHEIADKLTAVGKKILDFIKNGDWKNLGKYLADGLNKGLQKLYDLLNWDNLKGRIVPFVTGFAKTLNSLLDNVDFDLMGRILGTGLNSLVNTMNTWYDNFDFVNLGRRLAAGVKGFIDEVDWHALGNYLGNKFMSMWYVLYGFVSDLDFTQIGTAIATALNGLVEEINLGVIADAITTGFNGIFTSLQSAVNDFDWMTLTLKLKSGINHFVYGINFENAARAISGFINKAFETIRRVLSGNWPIIFARKFNNGLNTFIGELKWDEVGSTIRLAIDQLILMFYELVRNPRKYVKLGAKFASTINAAIAPKKTALTEGKAGEALANAFNSFFAFLEGLIDGTNGEDGIKWDDLKDILVVNINKFFTKLDMKNAGETLGKAFSKVLHTLNDVIEDTNFWEQLGNEIGDFLEGINWDEVFQEVIRFIKNAVSGLWQGLGRSFAGRIFLGISLARITMAAVNTFINPLVKAFTGKTIQQKIGSSFGSMFKKAVEEGADTAGKAVKSGSIPALVKFAGLVAAAVGTFEATSVEVGTSEKDFTASGVFKDIYDNLEEIGTKAGLSTNKIELLKKQFDNIADSESAVEVMDRAAEVFGHFGISAETVKTAVSGDMSGNLETVAKHMEIVGDKSASAKANIETVGSTAQQTTLDLSSYGDGTAQWSGNVYAVVDQLATKYTDFGHNVDDLRYAFENQYKGTESAQEAYNLLKDVVEKTGGKVSTLNEIFKNEFPDAVEVGGKAVTTEVNKASANTQQKFESMSSIVSRASSEIKTNTTNDFSKMESAVTGSVQGAQKETDTSFSSIDKKITDVNSEVEGDTDSQFGSLKSSAVGHITDMKDSLDKEMDEISKHMHSRFETLATFLPNHFDGIGDAVAGKINDIPSKLQEAVNNMDASLRSIGVSIISAIQTGLLYNPIKLPHIVQDRYNPFDRYYYGDNQWLEVPRFMVDWYAKGGLFTTPTIAGFGEAGDEAALPLSNKGVMSRIANAIVDNSDGFGGMTQEDMVEAVATGVAMAMSQNPQTVEVVVNSVIKTSDEKLAQAVSRGRARLDQRYNATPSMA